MKRNICLFIVVILDFFDILLFHMCIWVFFYFSLIFLLLLRNTHRKSEFRKEITLKHILRFCMIIGISFANKDMIMHFKFS